MKYVVIGLGVIVLLAALVGGSLTLRYFLAAPTGAVEQSEQIRSGSYRIAAYDHFFNLCATVQSNEAALDAQYEQLTVSTDQKDISRVQANIAGIKAERARNIYQYNQDARKDYTEGQFRDSKLPYQLPTSEYVKGGRTSCGY